MEFSPMTNDEYAILSNIHRQGGKLPYSYVESMSPEELVAFESLRKQGYVIYSDHVPDIYGDTLHYESISITPEGNIARSEESERRRAAIEESERNAAEKAQHEKDNRSEKRRSWIQFVLRALLDIAIFLAGIYTGRKTTFADWFFDLFR